MSAKVTNTYIREIEAAISQQAVRCCEGFVSASGSKIKENVNQFGRTLITDPSTNLSFIQGLALTGLRSCAIVATQSETDFAETIKSVARQHLPLVFHQIPASLHGNIGSAAAIQLNSTTAQEAIDFVFIAHRIAELSLLPCVHNVFFNEKIDELNYLSSEELVAYLGNPDDIIETPTPAQAIIFGAQRRRLPHYYSLDQPVQISPLKDDSEHGLEVAANKQYFHAHSKEIIERAFAEFATITGRQYTMLLTHNVNKSDFLLVSDGGLYHHLKSFLEVSKNSSIGLLESLAVIPGTSHDFNEMMAGKKGVTFLIALKNKDRVFINLDTTTTLAAANTKVCFGKYVEIPSAAELLAIGENMVSAQPKREFFIGLSFNKTSEFPKHQILLEQISRAYPDIDRFAISGTEEENSTRSNRWQDASTGLPMTVRQYKDEGAPYTRLNRFYSDTGQFYQHNSTDDFIADPFQALPAVPPVTAAFSGVATDRETLPVFVSENCSGCGACFVQCPHSAIPPIAIGLESLIQYGMSAANAQGAQLTAMIPLIKNYAKTAAKIIKKNSSPIHTADDFLDLAFDSLVKQMSIQGEKLDLLKGEFSLIKAQIASFPVSINDVFFNEPELVEKGSGELFSLAVDASACTGCGICCKVCADEALIMVEENPEMVNTIDNNLHLWEKLPDTNPYTINRLLEDADYDSFAAIMLSRSIYLSMTGAGKAESDHYPKTMLHLVSSVAESIMQPRYSIQVESIKSLIQELAENIHHNLSDSIPREDFEGLQKVLDNVNGTTLPFEQIIAKIGNQERLKQVNTQEVSRKITLLHDLKTLEWLITQGPSGTGRARFGLAINDKGLKWANQYPFNSFTSPAVVHWDSSLPHLSLGMIYGQLRYLLDNIKLLRRAKLEVKNQYVPGKHDKEIARLDWNNLTEEEKGLIPPIFIVGEEDIITSALWADLAKLMQLEVPIKVIVLDSMTVSAGDKGKIARSHAELMSLITLKSSFVFQGSLGNSSALFNGLVKGISTSNSAFLKLLAPNSRNFVSDYFRLTDVSAVANLSRSFPTIEFNPQAPTEFLNGMIDLASNPDVESNWSVKTLEGLLDGELTTVEFGVTWADWAYIQMEWEGHFNLLTNGLEGTVALSEFAAAPENFADKIPVIYRLQDNKIVGYSVSEEIIEIVGISLQSWNMLREISGLLTPFPDKLKEEVKLEMGKAHQEDIELLKAEFQTQLAEMEQKQMESVKIKLKNKLVELANKRSL